MKNKYKVGYSGRTPKRGPFKQPREGGSFDARAQSPGEGSRDKSANNSINSFMQVTTATEMVPVPVAQGLATPFVNLLD